MWRRDVLRRVFGQTLLSIFANKSQLGHAMGALSAIETVLPLEGMLRNTVLPTINYVPDPEIPLESIADKAISVPEEYAEKFLRLRRLQFLHRVFQRTA